MTIKKLTNEKKKMTKKGVFKLNNIYFLKLSNNRNTFTGGGGKNNLFTPSIHELIKDSVNIIENLIHKLSHEQKRKILPNNKDKSSLKPEYIRNIFLFHIVLSNLNNFYDRLKEFNSITDKRHDLQIYQLEQVKQNLFDKNSHLFYV